MKTTETTARKCPICGNTGDQVGENLAADGETKVKTMKCTTVLCRWHDTNWIYQVDEDGSVPEHDYETKVYPTRDQMPTRPSDQQLETIFRSIRDEDS